MTEQPERPQRSNDIYPWMKPRHILPTEYSESQRRPYPGYKAPEGSPWFQSLHREISTPEGGGYFKNKYTFDYNGKTYNVPLDENLAIDVGFPQLADQYRFGINYNQYTPANSRLYWSNPQRVARIKTLIDSMPEGEELPDWLDVDQINTLYNYMEFLNPNKPFEEWAPLSEDDPAYNMLYNIPQPPQDMISPYERDPVYASNAFLQDYQKRYSEQNVEESIKSLMESRGITFPEAQTIVQEEQKANFDNLEPAQKWLVAMNSLVPQDSNAPDWMKDVSIGTATGKAVIGGFGATSALIGGTGMVASMLTTGAATGASLGPWGLVAGGAVGLGMGLATYLALKRGDEVTATKLLMLFNKPAEWTEQFIGAGAAHAQLRELGLNPLDYDYADLWEAGKGYYESELYGIGNLEANLVQAVAHKLKPEWSSGLQAGSGEVWQLQKGIVEPQAIREGYLVGSPLTESVIRLASGENEEAVYWDMVDRYGYSGTRADFHAQNWIDPMQYVPFLTTIFGEKIAGRLGNPMLAKSFASARGNVLLDALPGNIQMPLGLLIRGRNRLFGNKPNASLWKFNTTSGIADVIGNYRINVANQSYFADLPISAYGIENMTTAGKILAGIDPKTNMPMGVPQLDSDGKVILSRGQTFWGSTPEAAIGKELFRLNSMFAYQGALNKDPVSFMESMSRLVEGAEYVKAHPNDPLAYAYDSPNAKAIRNSLGAALESDPIKMDMTLWKASEGKRQAIKGISEALSMKPENIIQMMKDGKYSELIEQLRFSTNVKNPAVEAVQSKMMTAESLKKSVDVFVKNNTPYYPEMMTVRLENRITDFVANRLGTAYGLDLKQQGKLWKWVGLNKSVQSLALLNTPNFVMKNLLNNMVTMGYDGIGSLFTVKHNDAIMARYGLTAPDEMKIGYGSIGKMMATPETARTVVDQLQTWTNKVSEKIGIFTKMAGNIEGKAKYTAYANGVQDGFESYYKEALPRLPEDVRQALIKNGTDPDTVENLIVNMTRAEQFDSGPDFNLANKAVLSDSMQSAIEDLYPNPDSARDMVNKLSIIDNALRYIEEENMSVDTALSRVYEDLRAKAIEQLATEVASTYEEASQDVNTSGWGAFLKIVDDLDVGPRQFQLEIARDLHDLTIETSRFRKQNPTPEGRKLANEYYLVRADELDDRVFLENKEAIEKTMAIVHRLNPGSEIEATLSGLLIEKMHLVQEMNRFVMEENAKYWGADEPGDYEVVQAKVRKGQESYSNRIETLSIGIDEQIIKIFNFDEGTKKQSTRWVQNNRKMREEIAQLNNTAFKKLEDSSEAGRRIIWQRALDKRMDIIAKYSSANAETSERMNQSLRNVKHNGPTAPKDMPPEPEFGPLNTTPPGGPSPALFEPAEQMPDADTLKQTTYSGKSNYQGRNKQYDQYTLTQGRYGKGLEYDEKWITKAATEIEMIDNKYRGRWFKDNAVELKALRTKLQDLFSLSEQEGQMLVAILGKKAEDSTFRMGDMDPMSYIRRYSFEETTRLEMSVRAQLAGVKAKGTGSIEWDVNNAKWIIKAVKGKADFNTLLHELVHSWIFDLDRGDMIALNEIYKYGTVEELYNNHRGWLTQRTNDGEAFTGEGYMDYSKRTEEVVKIAVEYLYNKGRLDVPDPELKGIPGLINKFRSYVVNVMDKYRAGWSDQERYKHKMWVANTLISPTVEQALNRLYEGYRMDKVWQGESELLRAPVMGTMLSDVFGLNPDIDAKYLMYDVKAWEANKVAGLFDAKEYYKVKNAERLSKRIGLLPPDLERNIPADYAENTKLYGHPGLDNKTFAESRQDILNDYNVILELYPDDIKKISALAEQFKNEPMAFPEDVVDKYIVDDPDGSVKAKLMAGITAKELETQINVEFNVDPTIRTEWQRARYRRELQEVYESVDGPAVETINLGQLRNKLVYWSSFRDSELYGYSPEELAKMRTKFANGNGTITDPDVIASRDADFQKVADLSLLVTTATDIYDRIVKNPAPRVLNPDYSTFETESLETTYYRLRPSQAEAGFELKKMLMDHNKDVTIDGLSYYPKWQLPEYMREALGLKPTKAKTAQVAQPKPVSNTENPYFVSRNPFAPGQTPSFSDYVGSKLDDWPRQDAELLMNTIKKSETIGEDGTYTYKERFIDHPLLKDVPGEDIDMALKAISDRKYDASKQVQRLIVAEYMNRFLASTEDNSINIRTSMEGRYRSILEKILTRYVKPLEQAERYGYDSRLAPTQYARNAMEIDNIKKTLASLKSFEQDIDRLTTDSTSFNRSKQLSQAQADRLKAELQTIKNRYHHSLDELYRVVQEGVLMHFPEDAGIAKIDLEEGVKVSDNKISQADMITDFDNQSFEVSGTEKDFGINAPLSELDPEGTYKYDTAYDNQANNLIESLNKAYKNNNFREAERILKQIEDSDYDIVEFLVDDEYRLALRGVIDEINPVGRRADQDAKNSRLHRIMKDVELLEDPDPIALYKIEAFLDPADWPLHDQAVKTVEEVGDIPLSPAQKKIQELKNKRQEIQDAVRDWENANYYEMKEINEVYSWNAIELAKTDPKIQADVDLEKRFINAYAHDVMNRSGVKSDVAYRDIQEEMIYKIVESYYLWDKEHGAGTALYSNDEFTIWMQRRVFPTLTNDNKKGSVYDLAFEERMRLLFTPREALEEYGLFRMAEYYDQTGKPFDINDWDKALPMFEVDEDSSTYKHPWEDPKHYDKYEYPDHYIQDGSEFSDRNLYRIPDPMLKPGWEEGPDGNPVLMKGWEEIDGEAVKKKTYTERYIEAFNSGDLELVQDVTYTAYRVISKMLQDGINETPIRIITAQDVLNKMFPRVDITNLDFEEKRRLFNFVNATYLYEARKVYKETNPYRYLLPGTEIGKRFNKKGYILPKVVAHEIIDLGNQIIKYRKQIAELRAKANNPVLDATVTAPFKRQIQDLEVNKLRPVLRKYQTLLKEFEPQPRAKLPIREMEPAKYPRNKKPNLTPWNQPVPEKPLRDVPAEDRSDFVPVGPPNPTTVSAPPLNPGRVLVDSLPDIKNLIDHARHNIRPIQAQSFEDISAGLTPAQRASFNEYLRQSKGAMASATQYAHEYGTAKANQALLDYNDRTGMDDWLDVVFPYQFWFTRSMVNWAKRMVNKPAILSKYANRISHMQRMGKDLGKYPVRLQGRMQIPWPFAEEWMGDHVYVNPFNETMPVNQILAPLDYITEAFIVDPTDRLKEMLNEKDITQEEYDQAMEEQSGDVWDLAYKLAEQDRKERTRPIDLASMMMSPNWALTETDAWLNNKTQRNMPMTNLGFTLESHGDRIKGNGYDIVGDALMNIGEWAQWPEKKIRGERFVYYDKHGVELVMRELSNMAAEGRPANECLTAMIEQKGDLWTEASERVRDQFSLKTPGSLLVQAMEEGDISSIPLGLVVTMFPAGIFPEGELTQLGLKEEFQSAWTKAGEGDAIDLKEWFEEHPEYLVRTAINDSPRLKMKKYLVNQIMDYYTGQEDQNKALFKEHLGPVFIDKILSEEPVDYDALDIEELTRWARMAKGNVPGTEETRGLQKALPEKDMPVLYDDNQINIINTYYEERERLFPNLSWQNKAYHNLNSAREKAVYLAKYPELKQYWEWNDIYKKNEPVIKEWTERNVDTVSQDYDPYYGISPEIIEGYKAEKAKLFPNAQWLNAEYFAIPSDEYQARKDFIAQHPELDAYWTWKKDVEAQSPQIKYYNAQQDAKYEAENAFPVAPADLAPNKIAEALDAMGILPYVQQDLISYYIHGKPIPYGSLSYMKDMWEKEGSPDTLMEYIDNLF